MGYLPHGENTLVCVQACTIIKECKQVIRKFLQNFREVFASSRRTSRKLFATFGARNGPKTIWNDPKRCENNAKRCENHAKQYETGAKRCDWNRVPPRDGLERHWLFPGGSCEGDLRKRNLITQQAMHEFS